MSESYSAKPRSMLDIVTKRYNEPYPECMRAELACYSQDDNALVRKHIERYFGKANKQTTIYHPLVQEQIEVHFIAPSKKRPYFTVVTHGLGACRMQVPAEFAAKQYERAELVLYLPSNWKIALKDWKANPDWYWPIRVLIDLAFKPVIEKRWWGAAPFVNYTHPLAFNTQLNSVVALSPDATVLESHVCALSNGEQVNFYRLLPLYSIELEYGLQFGWFKLIELWRSKLKFSFKTKIHRPCVLAESDIDALAEALHDPEVLGCERCYDFSTLRLLPFTQGYTLEQFLAVQGHIKHYFGSPREVYDVYKEIEFPAQGARDVHPVTIYVIAPTEQHPFYTIVTIGLGARLQHIPYEIEQIYLERTELVLFLPPDWKLDGDYCDDPYWGWPLHLIVTLVQGAQRRDDTLYMISGVTQIFNQTECKTVMFFTADSDPDYIEAGADSCFLPNGERVNFLAVVQLGDSEKETFDKIGNLAFHNQRMQESLIYNPKRLASQMQDGTSRKRGGAPHKSEGTARKSNSASRKPDGAPRKSDGAPRKSDGAPRKARAKPTCERKNRRQ